MFRDPQKMAQASLAATLPRRERLHRRILSFRIHSVIGSMTTYNRVLFVSVHNCSVAKTRYCPTSSRIAATTSTSTCHLIWPALQRSLFSALAHLLLQASVRALPRFRGNLLYVVQQFGTTAIPIGDFHNDLHRSVQKSVPQANHCASS